MKCFNFKTAIASIIGIAVLGFGVSYSQNQFNELYDILFRTQNPQIRLVGTGSVRNQLGTSAGAIAMARPGIVTTAATRTLLFTECGATVVGNAGTGTQVFTLPSVANTGCQFTFVAGDADGEILINALAVSTCVVTVFGAVGTDADTAIVTDTSCEAGLKNTAATNAIGDSLTLISDGTRWLGMGISSGIWAVQ